jgi:proteasome lid subunit RPN8/RPN11
MKVTVEWNGFIKICCEAYPEERAAFLYADKPFSGEERWTAFPVKNVSEDPENSWIPDKKDMARIKREAKKLKLTQIGNVHSHPFLESFTGEDLKQPSDVDLRFARRFNDTIRGILVVDKTHVYDIYWHDQFNNQIEIYASEE